MIRIHAIVMETMMMETMMMERNSYLFGTRLCGAFD